MKPKTLVITGGHHTSALVIAKALANRGWNIVWFGHRHSMWGDQSDSAEYKEVTATGIVFYDLKAGKFYRTFNLLKLARIPLGFIQAFVWLLKTRPTGIVSFGGYLAVPTVCMGWLLNIPAITHEQTTTAGWANRVICYLVKKVCLSYPDNLGLFPKSKIIVTGLPIRPEILKLKYQSSKSPSPTIFITCGKQGSHVINETIFQVLPDLLRNYEVIHQTGSSSVFNDYTKALDIIPSLPSDLRSKYKIHGYLPSEIQAVALSRSSLVIGRSGAHITYELAILGIPSILIPLPDGSHDEQWQNAKLLESHNLARIITQKYLTPQRLLEEIAKASKLKSRSLDLPLNATEKIVQIVESVFQ